jgi:hypothetical protein
VFIFKTWYNIAMNKTNYDALMRQQMQAIGLNKPIDGINKPTGDLAKSTGDFIKPTLLLHACCAPCSSACLERLKDTFKITVLFYNPNIEDEEYLLRKKELVRFIAETGWATILDCDHEKALFYSAVKGLEDEPERGKRCKMCYALRLKKTCELAEANGFDYFATTLTLSPLKDASLINEIGFQLSQGKKIKWLFSDFKKGNGYVRSLQLSKEYCLYRQNYCGCIYSKRDSNRDPEHNQTSK